MNEAILRPRGERAEARCWRRGRLSFRLRQADRCAHRLRTARTPPDSNTGVQSALHDLAARFAACVRRVYAQLSFARARARLMHADARHSSPHGVPRLIPLQVRVCDAAHASASHRCACSRRVWKVSRACSVAAVAAPLTAFMTRHAVLFALGRGCGSIGCRWDRERRVGERVIAARCEF